MHVCVCAYGFCVFVCGCTDTYLCMGCVYACVYSVLCVVHLTPRLLFQENKVSPGPRGGDPTSPTLLSSQSERSGSTTSNVAPGSVVVSEADRILASRLMMHQQQDANAVWSLLHPHFDVPAHLAPGTLRI